MYNWNPPVKIKPSPCVGEMLDLLVDLTKYNDIESADESYEIRMFATELLAFSELDCKETLLGMVIGEHASSDTILPATMGLVGRDCREYCDVLFDSLFGDIPTPDSIEFALVEKDENIFIAIGKLQDSRVFDILANTLLTRILIDSRDILLKINNSHSVKIINTNIEVLQ